MFPLIPISDAITLSSYMVFGAAALATGALFTGLSLLRHGASPRQTGCLLLAMTLAFLAGARLFNSMANPTLYSSAAEALTDLHWRNLSLVGGMAGGSAAGFLVSRRFGMDIWTLGDSSAYGLAPAVFLAKLGCLMNGCCFGTPTDAAWGLHYPMGSTPYSYGLITPITSGNLMGMFSETASPLHPVQLYEGIGSLLCLATALALRKRFPASGSVLLIYAALFSAVRLASWQFRVPPPGWALIPAFYPSLYTALALGCLAVLIHRNRRANPDRT